MNLEGNSPIPEPSRPMFEDCTVTSVDPLEIQRDCDESPIPFTPDTMIAPELLAVEDRVRVELAGERLIVVGRGNGFAVDSEATAGALALRDASGRVQFATPSADGDAATKGYVDGELGSLDTALQNLMSAKGVIPSSVDVGSGSASVAEGGTVSLTNVGSYVSLNGIFDGLGADVYGLTLVADCTAGATLLTRLRVGGVDTAGTAYNRTAHYTQLASGPTRSTATGQPAFGFWSLTTAGTTRSIYGQATLFRPMLAAQTGLHLTSELVANSDWYMWQEVATGPSTAHDGISLILSTGTMTGTLRVVKLA